MKKNVLKLTIKRKWFNAIAAGIKHEEYRDNKPHWNSRLDGKEFQYLEFINGYSKNAPRLYTECEGIIKGVDLYVIRIGKIIAGPLDFILYR